MISPASTARPMPEGIRILPSLLSADFADLRSDIRKVEEAGAQWLHLDVMDGHFVPNITFGPSWAKAVRQVTNLYLDAHLMITSPMTYIDRYVKAGVDLITVHAEIDEPLDEIAGRCHETGTRFGLAFRPATDPAPFLDRLGSTLDLVLVMTVEPGFGGQSFMEDMAGKIEAVRDQRTQQGGHYKIQVDGGIHQDTAPIAVGAGAELLVAGYAVFGGENPGVNFTALTDLLKPCGEQ